jgi:anti-sigma regulatory factor (Ser/Thr protein kinase)
MPAPDGGTLFPPVAGRAEGTVLDRSNKEGEVDVHEADQSHLSGQPVVLTLPADTRMARVARLTASALGSLIDFSVDDIDDLRIGVDEMVVTLIELGQGEPLVLEFHVGAGQVRVRGRTPVNHVPYDRERQSLSQRILAVVADEHQMSNGDGWLRMEILKQATTP